MTRSTRLIASLLVFLTAILQGQQPYLVFKGTDSPDGAYALAWGSPDPAFNPKDPGSSLDKIDTESIENYVVSLKRSEVIGLTGTRYFETRDASLNHASLMCLWRPDSKAVLVIQDAKWGMGSASLVYVDAAKEAAGRKLEPVPLTSALENGVVATLLKAHPEHSSSIREFAIGLVPLEWSGDRTVEFRINGAVPKSEDDWSFEGKMALQLPGPLEVSVSDGTTPDPPKPADDPAPVGKYQITSTSAAEVRLGMTLGDARTLLASAKFSKSMDGEGLGYLAVEKDGEILMRLLANDGDPEALSNPKAKITFIEVLSPTFQTADGTRVGMSGSELIKHYGPLKEIAISEVEAREYATFTDQPLGLVLRMTGSAGSGGAYDEGSTVSNQLRPDARLSSIEIVGGQIMDDGRIAGIGIGATQADLIARAEAAGFGELYKGKDEVWEAIGEAVQTWVFPDVGLSFDMASAEIGGLKTVFSITAKAPCGLPTGKGVRIGDPVESVNQLYTDYPDDLSPMDGHSEDEGCRLVGSPYGGMAFFHEKGKVTRIFLGAMAE